MSKDKTTTTTITATFIVNGVKLEQVFECHEGWDIVDKYTLIGKQLFRCKTCLRESPTPDRWCAVGPIIEFRQPAYNPTGSG